MIPWNPSKDALGKADALLKGAYDMHTHAAPSIFARRADDRQTAQEAGAAGMAAVVIKCHEGDTAARAQVLDKDVSLPSVYGGLVLNHFVGGINPAAVEITLRLGGRFIWLPTVSAAQHVTFHANRQFLGCSFQYGAGAGIRMTQPDGALLTELFDVFDLVSEAETVLCTGHVSTAEVLAVAGKFLKGGYRGHFVYTHPDVAINRAPLEAQVEVAEMGGIIEKCTIAGLPEWGGVTIGQFVDDIRKIGVDRCFISTDAGGPDRPSSPETFRSFLGAALDYGMTEAEIRTTLVDVPRRLINL